MLPSSRSRKNELKYMERSGCQTDHIAMPGSESFCMFPPGPAYAVPYVFL